MMNRITRRLSAVVLGAALLLSPVKTMAEMVQMPVQAQVVITMEDGAQHILPVQTVTTSEGETVYWLDMSLLMEEQV